MLSKNESFKKSDNHDCVSGVEYNVPEPYCRATLRLL